MKTDKIVCIIVYGSSTIINERVVNMAKAKRYIVVTSSGLEVFRGTEYRCKQYIKQALEKGSVPGFLKIQPV